MVPPQTRSAPTRRASAYAQPVEELGFGHVLAYDHVLGADPEVHAAGTGPTTCTRPSTSRSCCSATWPRVTSLELVTGVIILPQRQTALVAKQAAEVDLLTGGRFRLGVGVGWNAVEYEALGKDFTTAAAGSREQIELLRRLWTERGHLDGHYEQVIGAGLAPLPVQRPIPVWFGGQSPPASSRSAGCDGWFPQVHRAAARRGRAWSSGRGQGRPRSVHPRHGGSGELGEGGLAACSPWAGGARPGQQCRSTRWAPASPRSTVTWPRDRGRRSAGVGPGSARRRAPVTDPAAHARCTLSPHAAAPG